ncbi:hypothetical protein GCM10023340_09840 [Nocardioides marinquilinus]|uniref:Uncharacterized protein n=1 Tax=Nocardioides marinquilinus TaxID=1210400 RepID=A0ABP9PCW7_9ACTN
MTSPVPARRISALSLVALAVSLLSLVVGVGATSYAAGLARGSVGTPQLRDGAVTTPKIANGAVTGTKVRNGTIGRADLIPGVAAPRPVYARRSLAVDATPVRVATVNGVRYDLRCLSSGAQGVIAVLDVTSAVEGGPLVPLTGSYTIARRDAGTATDVTTAGASDPFSNIQLLAYAAGPGVGRTTLTGLVQYLDQPPARVDLGLAGTGGGSRLCRFAVLVAPLG